MPTVYTDSKGTYFQLGSVLTSDPSQQIVNQRSASGYQSIDLPVAEVEANLASGWVVAPGLTDIGSGIWVAGALVDPPAGVGL